MHQKWDKYFNSPRNENNSLQVTYFLWVNDLFILSWKVQRARRHKNMLHITSHKRNMNQKLRHLLIHFNIIIKRINFSEDTEKKNTSILLEGM